MPKSSHKSDKSEIRLFIAVSLSAEILNKLEIYISENRSFSGIRWVNTANIHLTLKFLGNVEIKRIPKICDRLDSLTSRFSTLSLAVTGIGCFPNPERPRIIWAGIHKNAIIIQDIASKLDEELHSIGFEKEKRPFTPHITIGRIKDPKRFAATSGFTNMVQKMQRHEFGECDITKISLIQSLLRPEGPLYTEVHSSPLSQKVDSE